MPRVRQLAAIMFTDIQGYTALMQQDEEKAIQARNRHRRIFNARTDQHKGRILQYYGDGTLSIFDSAIEAVLCAIDMQLEFQEEPALPVRIGIHTGDIVWSEEEIIGDSVNVASRIESLAVPGSVLVSEKVYDEIKNQQEINTRHLKAVRFKNVAKPIEVFAIANSGLVVPAAEALKGKTESEPSEGSGNAESIPDPGPQAQLLMPILATKLFLPKPGSNLVQRPRLIARLNEGLGGKLTLVSAPAGFGKTTLVSEWVNGITNDDLGSTNYDFRFASDNAIDRKPEIKNRNANIAWLSLDETDSDPTRFLTYLIAALQPVVEGHLAGTVGVLQAPQPAPSESILTHLINELSGLTTPVILVLDDYHLVESRPVDEALTFLLDHLPPQIHLVMTTRVDPILPLSRLRVRRRLIEVRASDLRFTEAEAANFLNQMMGLSLTPGQIAALESRTEGWIAGLQLAAISMQDQTDKQTFIESFTGSHRFVLDYLAEEVLLQQPENVRHFLLHSAILERLSGPLCDAVLEKTDGTSQVILESLEQANLFLIPLDNQRKWYRYHHLFGDVLRARAAGEQADIRQSLHLRASEWYEAIGYTADSIRHALEGKWYERAADLIEFAWPEMDWSFQTAIWQGWVSALPQDIQETRPVLSLGHAWALLSKGEIERAEAYLRHAEKWLNEGDASGEMVVVDEKQFRALPASIATARAYRAQAVGDISATLSYAKQALTLIPPDDYLQRGPPAALLSLAQWANGDLIEAYASLRETMNNFRLAGNIPFAISGTYGMADIQMVLGRLHDAKKTYEESLTLAKEVATRGLKGISDLYFGLAIIAYEQGEMPVYRQHLEMSEGLGESAALPDWPYRRALALAHIHEVEGDFVAAHKMLDEAERVYFRSPVPDVRPLAARKVRVWLQQKNFIPIRSWLEKTQISSEDTLSFMREFEHMVWARILMSDMGEQVNDTPLETANDLLRKLRAAAEAGKRAGSLIEVLILSALLYEKQGDKETAITYLERALTLAEPEGYVQVFAYEGKALVPLLSEVLARSTRPTYVARLRAACESVPDHSPVLPDSQALVEPLSQRELEVLDLIAKGFSNQAISDRLFLALSTVKGHNRNIFGKLGVQRRTEAVARARELGLI